MTGIRLASDERWLTGGLTIAVWASALAGIGLLFSGGAHRAAAPTVTVTVTLAPAPDVEPIATLPPTLVVAGRTDVYEADCARVDDGVVAGHRCTAALQGDLHSTP